MTIPATLDGRQILARQPVSWALTVGTRPYMTLVELPRADAEDLLASVGTATVSARADGFLHSFDPTVDVVREVKGLRTVELVLAPPGHRTMTARGLYVMGIDSSDHPDIARVLLADRRVWLPRQHLASAYNVRRRTGRRRIVREGNAPEEIAQINDDVDYAPWSLEPKSSPSVQWVARSMLEDVLRDLFGDEWEIRGLGRHIPVEGLQLDDPGDGAISRAMAYLSGVGITINLDSRAIVFDRHDRSERAAAVGLPVAGPQLITEQDLSISRPIEIHALFSAEYEVRLDSRSEGGDVIEDSRTMENVLPVPDYTLTLASGAVVAQGTWITYEDAFAAWALNRQPFQVADLSHEIIQQSYFVPGFTQLMIDPVGANGLPDAIIANRLRAAVAHYRRTYRVDRRFLDRISEIRAERAAILDPENGTRAPAVAYSDWSVQYTARHAFRTTGIPVLIESFAGFAANLVDARPAPASVTIADQDQGIIAIDYLRSVWGREALIAPGRATARVAGAQLPSADPREARRGRGGVIMEGARLAAGHRVSVVLTMVPASPNTDARFYRKIVKPEAASAVLGVDVGECRGPHWEVRISPHVERARFPWIDSREAEIEAGLGLLNGGNGVEPIDEDSLEAVAQAAAASVYSHLLDRTEGSHVTALNPDVIPTGNIRSVVHTLAPSGAALTTIGMPSEIAALDMTSLMPEGVRRRVMGLVDQRDGR